MKALILAGGLGTRLRPRFGDLPKPLAPLGGRPFLARQLEWLAAAGVREAVLCVGHGAAAVREALGDGAALGVRVEYSVEAEPLGTGGALLLAEPHVSGPCIVANGDTLALCDPWELERARWENGAIGAVALFRVGDAAGRGRVETGAGGRIERFVEKDPAHRGPAEGEAARGTRAASPSRRRPKHPRVLWEPRRRPGGRLRGPRRFDPGSRAPGPCRGRQWAMARPGVPPRNDRGPPRTSRIPGGCLR